ncbi:hypothetical protein [Clostridium culturomicium]|uniref:hypothetical protein n=1 Tax=Clostridium culturomicium TaxID=1499683 RepID=UPI00058AEAA7|nr:hypothetical protein [Clostridium culturomicium]
MMNCFKSYKIEFRYEYDAELRYIYKEVEKFKKRFKDYNVIEYCDGLNKIYRASVHINIDNYRINDTKDKEVLMDIENKNYYKNWMIPCNGSEDLTMAEAQINSLKDKYGKFVRAEKIMNGKDILGYSITVGSK